MDINDDIYRCPAHEFELCVSALEERHSHRYSHTCLCVGLCVCVCARAIAEFVSLRCSLWPLTPQSGSSPDKWDGRVLARTANIPQQSSVLLLPSPHIRHSSPLHSSLSVSLFRDLRASWGKFSLQTNTLYSICCGNLKLRTPSN